MKKDLTIKYKGVIPCEANSYSTKFNQIVTLLRNYHDDTVINKVGRTIFKEPKYYAYGYLHRGFTAGTKRGWTLNLPQKGMSMEMEYHSQRFEEINDLYWVFESIIFPFPEDAVLTTKKLPEKDRNFSNEHKLNIDFCKHGKRDYITFNMYNCAMDMQYDSSIQKSDKYYAIYFGDENFGFFEKGLLTHCLPNVYLYFKQFDYHEATLIIIKNGKPDEETVIYFDKDTDLQAIATNWLNSYYGGSNDMEIKNSKALETQASQLNEKLNEDAKIALGVEPKKVVTEYKNEKKYGSELAIIKTGLKYYDRRYQDFYLIEKMEVIESGDVDVTMKYEKGETRTNSGDFILYHIEAKQHALAKF